MNDFDCLYECFDDLIEFLKTNPDWTNKLYTAKERFVRSKYRHFYSTDFFGLYDESKQAGRNQIAFYYSTHFHEFIASQFPALARVPAIIRFFNACLEIQKPYGSLFNEAAAALGVDTIFTSTDGHPAVLLKVVKYLPSYKATRPHYDGSTFSLFLDSTDNQSLLLSPYRPSYTVDDFSSPSRRFPRQDDQNSIVLIPGTLLREFSIFPTPHLVAHSGQTRYATIAFGMRPDFVAPRNEFAPLPALTPPTRE